jgi:membrane protease subunit HflK
MNVYILYDGRLNKARKTKGSFMAWDSNDGKGPWGGRDEGKNWQKKSSGPSNIEDFIRKTQNQFKGRIPTGMQNYMGIGALALLAFVIWIGSGFYIPQEGEQSAVLRFGKYVRTTGPGLSWHMPYPIEQQITRRVSQVNQINSEQDSPIQVAVGNLRETADQPLMLTGDENIIDVAFTVQWFIKDLSQFLFKAKEPELTVKIAAESIIREIVAQTTMSEAITKGRGAINDKALEMLQKLCDDYQLGIQIKEVSLQRVEPPKSVVDAYRSVQRAKAVKEQKINEAETYRNGIVPIAEGEAIKIIQIAEGYKTAKIAKATGEAGQFVSVLQEYKKAPEVTSTRMRIETVQKLLQGAPKVYFDSDSKGIQNVLPHMALPALIPKKETKEGTE